MASARSWRDASLGSLSDVSLLCSSGSVHINRRQSCVLGVSDGEDGALLPWSHMRGSSSVNFLYSVPANLTRKAGDE